MGNKVTQLISIIDLKLCVSTHVLKISYAMIKMGNKVMYLS